MGNMKPGDIVETIKGAKWWGEVCENSPYRVPPISDRDDGWRADVRATHPEFEGSIHVYPVAQLRLRKTPSYRIVAAESSNPVLEVDDRDLGRVTFKVEPGQLVQFRTVPSDQSARIAELEAALAEAYEALKPFAREADEYETLLTDGNAMRFYTKTMLSDLRRARDVYSKRGKV